MRIYVDGSALCRYLLDSDEADAWRAWAASREPSLVTSQLSVTELRRVADAQGLAARAVAHGVAERLEVVRISDQALVWAARVTSVLSPFGAIHLGVALGHPDVTVVATYDSRFAAVSVLYGLDAVAPGRPRGWWGRA